MRLLIFILTFFFNASFVQAKETNPLGLSFFGSFLHTERVPNALFFFSEIKDNDSFELRKALRSHEIDTIVLSSRGGSVWEGLNMAGIIHDQRLKTYVPARGLREAGNCASACSFMFFGGSSRIADGALGVHQFYSGAAKQNAQIGESQSAAQFTVSEIIGFLNEFDTPPFVFERMFQQKEMYYFNADELAQINRATNLLTEADKTAINRFIRLFNLELERLKDEDESTSGRASAAPKVAPKPAPKTTQPQVSDRTVIRAIQSELNRLNCDAGRPDGLIGSKTRAALRRYASAIKRELPEYVLSSTAFLNVIRSSKIKCAPTPQKLPNSKLNTAYCDKPTADSTLPFTNMTISNYRQAVATRCDFDKVGSSCLDPRLDTKHTLRLCDASSCETMTVTWESSNGNFWKAYTIVNTDSWPKLTFNRRGIFSDWKQAKFSRCRLIR